MERLSDSTKDMGREHEQTLIGQGSQPKSMEWTDEKHSLYLKSMEASFVDHLYGSLDTLGWHSQNDKSSKSSRHKHASSSGQYKVFQDGCWTKMDFRKDEPQLNKTNETSAALASPWIKHYVSTSKYQTRLNSDLQENITEVMDQNFIDEDPKEGKSSKRTKVSSSAGTSSDQVVPFGVCILADDDDLAQNLME